MAVRTSSNIILDVKNLKQYFPIYKGLLQRVAGYVKAVDGVSFFVREREVLGLVGESGCGKTTTGRCVIRAIEPTSGQVRYRRADGLVVEVPGLDAAGLRAFRREACG